MDREGFRNRLKQYKKAREENPGLKYWEWRNVVSTEENPIYYSELEDLNSQLSEIEPLLNERKSIEQALVSKRLELSEKHKVPYLKDKEITLTNAGSMTGARLTTNLLDSIAKYANKTGLSLLEAVGLAALETTFGQNIRHFNKIYNNSNYDDYYVEDILSDWRYKGRDVNEYLEKKLNTPSAEAARLRKESFDYTMSKTNRMSAEEYEKSLILHKRELLLQAKDLIDFIINNYNDFEKAWSDYETKTVPPFEHAFEYYKAGKYNPGDQDHSRIVQLKGKEVMQSPEFKRWAKENNIKFAEGGEVDDLYSPVWPRVSKLERQIYFDRINPAAGFGFGDFIVQGMNYYFPEGERQKAPKEDEARWAAYLGLPYDKKYAPDTKIRFAHDKDYPNRQYQGLSKDAKKEIREEIIPTLQKSYSKLGDKWILITDEKPTDIIRNDEMYYPRLNHIGDLGKFGIREVNGSGIYEVGDKYDFPWYVPIPNRADGHELMIRDTIWSDRAKPELYIQRKAEGGEVEPDPLEVIERSRPKVAGIPINDKPLSGTDPLAESYLNLVSGNAVRKAIAKGIDGMVRKSFYNNYKELLKAGWNRQRAYDYASPELAMDVLPGIAKGFDYVIKGANYTHAAKDFIE